MAMPSICGLLALIAAVFCGLAVPGRGYTLYAYDQDLVLNGCDLLVSEFLIVQPDTGENITAFTHTVSLRSGWTFGTVPVMNVPGLNNTVATISSTDSVWVGVSNLAAPAGGAFNVSVAYGVYSPVVSVGNDTDSANALSWNILPLASPATINGSGVSFTFLLAASSDPFVALFQQPNGVPASFGSVLNSANDSFLQYYWFAEAAPTDTLNVTISWLSSAPPCPVATVQQLSAGAVVGIVLGTLVGMVLLIVALNFLCGYVAQRPSADP